MDLESALRATMAQPSPEALWNLRGELLLKGVPRQEPLWEVIDGFHQFLSDLSATATARQYSHYASLLDIAAVGGVALEGFIGSGEEQDRTLRLLLAAVSEGLMVLATRQHVKAWGSELESTYQQAAWLLYHQLWLVSADVNPEADGPALRDMIEALLDPVRKPEMSGLVKAVVIGRLFQFLLALRTKPLLGNRDS